MPISLIVTIEIVHIGQGIFMVADDKMKSSNEIRPMIQSSNLNDELGQVTHIFSDKTGTITQNVMEFKCVSISTKTYGEVRDMKDLSKLPKVSNVDFRDSRIFTDLKNKSSPRYQELR